MVIVDVKQWHVSKNWNRINGKTLTNLFLFSFLVEGRSHLERGRNYLKHINQTSLAMHIDHAHTVDFVPDIAHDARGMFYSPAGIRRLFLSNIDGTESARGVG